MNNPVTEHEARAAQLLLKRTAGWDEFAECFPKTARAVEMLPDTSGLEDINPICRDIIEDAIRRVRR